MTECVVLVLLVHLANISMNLVLLTETLSARSALTVGSVDSSLLHVNRTETLSVKIVSLAINSNTSPKSVLTGKTESVDLVSLVFSSMMIFACSVNHRQQANTVIIIIIIFKWLFVFYLS